jgi:lipoprotein-anchoring transpeptidase ErfK/SrfK
MDEESQGGGTPEVGGSTPPPLPPQSPPPVGPPAEPPVPPVEPPVPPVGPVAGPAGASSGETAGGAGPTAPVAAPGRSRLLTGGVGALVLVLIAVVVIIQVGGNHKNHPAAGHPAPVITQPASPTGTATSTVSAPTASATAPVAGATLAAAPAVPVPAPPAITVAPSSTIAYLNGPATIQVYGAADTSRPLVVLQGHNVIGQPEVFLVINDATPGWFQVLLPVMPNGTTGWIRSSDVQTASTGSFLLVSLSRFALYHYEEGKLVSSIRVAVGKPQTPTPTGLFYIWASQGVASAPYDPGIFALSGYTTKPVPGFLGARLGLHGWTDPSVIGTQASNGCVRVGSANMAPLLSGLLLGTPVEIVS